LDTQTSSPKQSTALTRAGQLVFPWRIALGAAAVVVGACIVRQRDVFGEYRAIGRTASLALVLLGLALRAWASASVGHHSRSGEIEAPHLVTSGPYAFVRNPIYLGSFILGLGMIGLLEDPWLLLPYSGVFIVFFFGIVAAEERFLESQFGEAYRRFRAGVPKLIPSLRPWRHRDAGSLCWRAARGEAVIGLALLIIYLGLQALG
jgi:protein-S-isoprenylcysteine O-methyltransferase Ste14